MNKRIIFGISALLMVFCLGIAIAQAAVEGIQSCKYCGMDREKFGHSRMYIEYDDGMKVGLCSLHCAAVDLALNIDKNPKEIKVADFNTKDLVDADKAVWVVGGNKMGVMTKRAKWAFAKKEDAEKFVKDNGGKISSFDEAIKAAYEDMYEDSKMIREKRKMMKMKGSEHKHH